jgi:hypothetical protein
MIGNAPEIFVYHPVKNQKAPKWGFSVGGIGLEPTTFAMSTQCSNQLSYPPEQGSIINEGARKWQAKKGSKTGVS